MNKRIESDDFRRNLILLVTLRHWQTQNHVESTTVLFPQDPPRPVVADVLFHTSQLSLAIPSYVGAIGTTNGDSVVTA